MKTTRNTSFASQTTLRSTLFALLIILGIAQTSLAQVTTNSSSGLAATYPTLDAAISAVNAISALTSPVIVTVSGLHVAPVGGYIITQSATFTNNVIIQGSNATITANGAQVAGSFTDAIFKLVGAQFVTIRNFTMQENPLNTTTAVGTNNMTEWGVALLYSDIFNGARSNTITGNTISLNRNYANSFGIYSNSRHSSTNVITVAEGTSNGSENSNNTVSANNISNVNFGITFIGSSGVFAPGGNNIIGGNTAALGNTITNWGGQIATVSFVSNDSDSYGIYIDHQIVYTISFNTLISATVSGTGVDMRGILQNNDVTVPNGTYTDTISNNTITINSNFAIGAVQHIFTKSGGANVILNITNNTITNSTLTDATSASQVIGILNNAAVGFLNINNNTVSNCSSAAADSFFTCIVNNGAVTTAININNNAIGTATAPPITYTAVNTNIYRAISNTGGLNSSTSTISGNDIRGVASSTTLVNAQTYIVANALSRISNVTSNTFTNISANTTSTITFIFRSTNMIATDAQNIINNSIVGSFTKNGTGGSVTCISLTGASVNGSTSIITNNDFSNISAPNTGNIRGVFSTDGTTTTAPNCSVNDNTFNNWTSTTATCDVINISRITANSNFNDNIITNISGANINGITIGNSFSGSTTLIVEANFISNLTATGNSISGITTTNIVGFVFLNDNTIIGLTSGNFQAYGISVGGSNVTVLRNKVGNIQVNGTLGQILGISLSSGTTATIANNIVGDLRTPSASFAANAITAINIGHTTPNSTVGVYFNTVNISATSTGANFSTAAFLTNANATATTVNLDMRNNIFINTSVANGASGRSMAYFRVGTSFANYATTSNRNNFFAPVIFFDGTNADATLAAYQTRVGTVIDANSISTNATFLSTTAAAATFLHLNPTSNGLLESTGGNVVGIIDDFDGDIRQVTTPDIGADEFVFVCPTITFTNTTIISPNATTGVLYTLNGAATASSGTFSYSISPALPAGLSINSTTGVISGTPTAATAVATYTVTARVFATCSATQTYTFSVISGCTPMVLGLASIPNATIGTPYSQTFTATGGTAGATYAFTTTSPQLSALAGNGLTLSAAGVLSGTPIFSTSITFRVTATTTPNSCTGFKDYTIVINPSSVTSVDNSLANLVKISPNPSNGDFNVDFGTINMDKSSVSVYDAQGKVVFTSENNSNVMNISLDKFADGIYLLEVKTSTGRITKRLAKQ